MRQSMELVLMEVVTSGENISKRRLDCVQSIHGFSNKLLLRSARNNASIKSLDFSTAPILLSTYSTLLPLNNFILVRLLRMCV
jgi:hypothetical protein